MTNFELTMDHLQRSLNSRLTNGYRRVMVQGCTKPGMTKLVFTIFDKTGYKIERADLKDIRFYKESGNPNEEAIFIDGYINRFRDTLSPYITYE
jgi:hypothetical protein